MSRRGWLAVLVGVGAVVALAGYRWWEGWRYVSPRGGLGPLPAVPVPADNPMTQAKVELGRLLFFDPRLSGDGSTSCATCHDPEEGWGTGTPISKGYPGTTHWRNAQTVVNSAYLAKLFWAGESLSLEKQAESAWTGNLAGNLDPAMAEEKMAQIPEYVRLFKEVFGTGPNWGDALRAVAAFERTIISRNVPFDRYAQGDRRALSREAKRGLSLFQGKAGCVACHSGPLLTDESYHALGVPRSPAYDDQPLVQISLRYQHRARGVPEEVYRAADRDLGLYYTTKRDQDRGKFRTPPLRDLCPTAPYMHNGVFQTLAEIIDFYDRGGGEDPNKSPLMRPLGLSSREKADLVAFMESLCGDPILVEAPDLPPYEVLVPEGGSPDE